MDNPIIKTEKLIKYGKEQLISKGVESSAENIRAVLDEISSIETGTGEDMLQARVDGGESCSYLFYKYTGESLDFIKNLDTSNATGMYSMFNSCENLTSLDLSNFNTSNVTTTAYMFNKCYALTNLDLSSFDTGKVTDMSYMFMYCYNLTDLDVSNFNTENVTNMSHMFNGCAKVSILDVSNFNTENVTNMSHMFSMSYQTSSGNSVNGNYNLKSIIFGSKFNTTKVTDMSDMFYCCRGLNSLDLSNFDTSNVTSMSRMFSGCDTLTSLDLGSFNTANVTSFSGTFGNCGALTEIIGTIDLIKQGYTNNNNLFSGCFKLRSFTLKNIKYNQYIGSGSSYGTLLDDPTIINTAMELWNVNGKTLTVSTPTSARLDAIYVKLIEATDEMIANDPYITSKKPCVVCSETDEGAMTLREYIVSKNWTISG